MVLHEKIGASLTEIQNEWTILDVYEAHLALDILEDLEYTALRDK